MDKRFISSLKPCHLGLMTIHMWIYCSTHRPTITEGVSIMTVMYLFLSAFLIALVLIMRKHDFSEDGKLDFDKAAMASMSSSALLFALPFPFSGATSTVIGCILGGIGVAWAYLRWGEFYSALDIRYATPLIFLTMAIGSCGKTVIDLLPDVPAGIVLACLPLATFFLLYRSKSSVPQSPEPYRYFNSRTIGSLWRLVLGIAAYSLVVGIVQSTPLVSESAPTLLPIVSLHGGEVLLSLALFAWVVVFKKGLSFSRTWRLVLVLMATALIFMPYLSESMSVFLFAFIGIAQTFLIILLYLALADIARHSTYRAMVIYACGWVAYSLPFPLGDIIGSSVNAFDPNASVVLSAIVWVLVIVTLFFLDETSAGNHIIFTELNDEGDGDTVANRIGVIQKALNEQEGATDVLALRCACLSKDNGLTPREAEILELLARGRSKTYIAEAFFISENTVRGHTKRLYAKLDVHSKQELVDKVEMADKATNG